MTPELRFAQNVVGARSSSSDWSGALKLATVVGVGVAGYFVYRHFVVLGTTAKGTLNAFTGKEATS